VKKVNYLIFLGLAIITGCMLYLIKSGISLRSSTLITPSEMDESMAEVSGAVFSRLFPEFQNRDLLVIGAEHPSPRVMAFINHLKLQSEAYHKNKIEIFDDDHLLGARDRIRSCSKSCWVLTEAQSTSDIAPMPSVMELAGIGEKNRFTLTIFEFDSYDPALIPNCEKQKRLKLSCLKNLAIKEAERKMHNPKKKYFFLKQYNSRDFFLFFQR
jgi:hypothetical protein